MQNLLNKDNKTAKVICCYFGERRKIHNTPDNLFDFLQLNIENELSIENEVPTDVFLINNDSGNIDLNKKLDCFNGLKTKNGKLIVESRPNIGGSFGAYYETFLKYKDLYNYWFFCEDDVLIYKTGYMKYFIDYLNSSDKLGFVSLAPLSRNDPIHSGGGCGLTSTDKFLKSRSVEYIVNYLSKCPRTSSYQFLENSEVEFTNIFIRSGYTISNHPHYSPFCDNYKSHFGQANHVNELINLEKIYKVGF